MTEAEWASQRHLEAMLKHLRDRTSGRKLRLFACACARRAEGCFRMPTTAMALAVAEGIAEGTETLEVLRDAHAIALEKAIGSGHAVAAEAGLAVSLLLARPLDSAREASREALHVIAPSGTPGGRHRRNAEAEAQRRLLRCVAGNPFRPVAIEPYWRAAHDGAAWRIARAIHDDRHYQELPLLADALEDAGCADEALLAHCRADRVHTRGCWVVDAVLGLE